MRIGIVAPGRPIDRSIADRVTALAAAAYPEARLVFHPQCFITDGGHFAGPDALRAAAFAEFADDPGIDALWFARGGYGANRIVATVDRLGPAAATKTWCGYSDAGYLLAALNARGIGRAVHAPMVADVARPGGEAAVARTLGWLVRGDRTALEPGLGGAPSIAFNLTILTSLIGTRRLPDLTGLVLIIEEVAEPLYRIDRMLWQLANAVELRAIAGLRLGRVSGIVANDPPFAHDLESIVAHWCNVLGVPLLRSADIGHDAHNKLVPFGVG